LLNREKKIEKEESYAIMAIWVKIMGEI